MYVSRREQTVAALAAFIIVLLLASVLVFGLRVAWLPRAAEVLVSVDLRPRAEPSRSPPPVRRASSSAPKGAPAPANLRNRATEVVAPPQIVLLPPPIAVATQAGTGSAASTGASDRAGPGTGAGGAGAGDGGGGLGGDGYGGGAVVGPRQIGGKLKFSDVPERLLGPGEEASVGVRFTVEINGRVTRCRISRSSRIAELDALVCRLIERRFRFRPARDQEGRPVRADVTETHNWAVEPAEPRREG